MTKIAGGAAAVVAIPAWGALGWASAGAGSWGAWVMAAACAPVAGAMVRGAPVGSATAALAAGAALAGVAGAAGWSVAAAVTGGAWLLVWSLGWWLICRPGERAVALAAVVCWGSMALPIAWGEAQGSMRREAPRAASATRWVLGLSAPVQLDRLAGGDPIHRAWLYRLGYGDYVIGPLPSPWLPAWTALAGGVLVSLGATAWRRARGQTG